MGDEMFRKEMSRMSFALDEMFSSQAQRNSGFLEEIKISEIVPFQQHSFQVNDNEEMDDLVESIRENGVMMPVITFRNENNQVEMIAGHRRLRACQILGKDTISCLMKNVTRDEATIIMGETNLRSRENILPSERGWTYRYMYEAMIRQGKRTDLTSAPVEQKLTSREKLAQKVGESHATIQRYIRLTYLNKDILKLVDAGIMAIRPAVEISYIDSINQKNIYNYYEAYEVTPSLAQAISLRQMAKTEGLDELSIANLLSEEKPNQKEKWVVKSKELLKYKGKSEPEEFEVTLVKAMDFYMKYKDKIGDKTIFRDERS